VWSEAPGPTVPIIATHPKAKFNISTRIINKRRMAGCQLRITALYKHYIHLMQDYFLHTLSNAPASTRAAIYNPLYAVRSCSNHNKKVQSRAYTRAQRPRFVQWELRNSRGSKIGPQDALGEAAEVVVWRYLHSHRLHEVLRNPPVHDDAQHQWTADAQCKQQPLQGRHFSCAETEGDRPSP
jgi:hypothetical protein